MTQTARPRTAGPRTAGPLTLAGGNAILADNFAPWVRDLGLVVEEVGEGHAVLRLPWSDRLAREGGALCGQALMAAADTAAVIAISAARGGYGPMTTVQQSTTFQRPVTGSDVLITTRVSKLGRTLAFIDATMTTDGAVDAVAQASTVYAVLG
jgi:uncharacterized protein (TIGR00369 family)